jgi:hypothetical protein
LIGFVGDGPALASPLSLDATSTAGTATAGTATSGAAAAGRIDAAERAAFLALDGTEAAGSGPG